MKTKFVRLQTKNDHEEKSYLVCDKKFVRTKADDDQFFYIEGYASTFGNVDRGGDVIIKGAFSSSITSNTPSFLWIHDFGDVIGVVEEIKEDNIGLFVKCKIPRKDSLVQGRVIPQIDIGSVKSFSIGYWAKEYKYDDDGNRVISEIELLEVSLVPLPMNPSAVITSAKTLDIDAAKEIQNKRDFERALRDLGCSQKAAVYLSAHFNMPESSDSNSDSELKSLLNELNELNDLTQKLKGI